MKKILRQNEVHSSHDQPCVRVVENFSEAHYFLRLEAGTAFPISLVLVAGWESYHKKDDGKYWGVIEDLRLALHASSLVINEIKICQPVNGVHHDWYPKALNRVLDVAIVES